VFEIRKNKEEKPCQKSFCTKERQGTNQKGKSGCSHQLPHVVAHFHLKKKRKRGKRNKGLIQKKNNSAKD